MKGERGKEGRKRKGGRKELKKEGIEGRKGERREKEGRKGEREGGRKEGTN